MTRMRQICLVVCLVLWQGCTVKCSARIEAKINYQYDIHVSDTVDGNLIRIYPVEQLTLDRLVSRDKPTLRIINFSNLNTLSVFGISLETMPQFRNVPHLTDISIIDNNLQTLTANDFQDVNPTSILIGGNQIAAIGADTFRSHLRELQLPCNKLSAFSTSWIRHPETIQVLNLIGNRIEALAERAFVRFTALTDLYISDNRIATIGAEAFGFAHIGTLYMNFNNLTHLPANAFIRDQVTIRQLHVDYNKLGFLSTELLWKLNLEVMSIDGNPWQCRCLRNIESWMRDKNVTVLQNYRQFIDGVDAVCVVPITNPDVCITQVFRESELLYVQDLTPAQMDVC